jgi:hypothetical protein
LPFIAICKGERSGGVASQAAANNALVSSAARRSASGQSDWLSAACLNAIDLASDMNPEVSVCQR